MRRADLLSLCAVAFVFAAFAYVCIAFTSGNERIATLWIPNAFAVGWILRQRAGLGAATILVCAVANLFVNHLVGDAWFTSICLALANALEIIIAVYLLRRFCGSSPELAVGQTQLWITISALVASLGSALVAACALAQGDLALLAMTMRSWVMADALSILVILPIVLSGIDSWRERSRPSSEVIVRWVGLVALVAVGTALVFAQSRFPLLFLITPLIFYSSLRCGMLGTAVAVLTASIIAIVATAWDSGPITLVRGGTDARIFVTQAFLATNVLMGIPIAALLSAGRRDRDDAVRSRDHAQEILNNVRDVIFRTDEAGRYSSLNPAWKKLTGFEVRESIGWPITKLLHPADLEKVQGSLAKLISGSASALESRQRLIDKDGKCRQVFLNLRRLSGPSGSFLGLIGNIRDETARHYQAQALEASERRFRALAESAPIGIFEANAEGELTFINEAWAAKVGKTSEGMLGSGWLDAVADLAPLRKDPPFANFAPGEVRHRSIEFKGPDGSSVWMDTYNTADFDDEGKVVGYHGAAVDVTEQRSALRRLADSESRFQNLATLAPAGIFRTDADGQLNFVNSAWLRMSGLSPTQWQGEGWVAAMHPDDLPRVATAWRSSVLNRTDCREEFRWRHADGSMVWVDTIARPEFDPAGTLTGFVGVNLDVTEKRTVEAALAERDRRLAVITENMTDAVLRLSLDGKCLYASPSASDLFKVPAERLLGANFLVGFHPEDDAIVRSTFAALASGEKSKALLAFRSNAFMQKPFHRWIEANCATVFDPQTGSPIEVIASLRNVAATKALESDLRAARAEAEHAAQAKSAFLANMSHEIRTPMNGLLGFTELLQRTPLDANQQEFVRMISDSGRIMLQLLNDILDLSKIEAGQLHIERGHVDVRHKMKSIVGLLDPMAHEKGVVLRCDVSDDTPEWILGDKLRLHQIVLNLAGNAVKFTAAGTVGISVRPDWENRRLVIAVQDTGVGIAEDKLESVFHHFTQADASIARQFGGSGLGLAITARLVDLLEGSIAVESELGRGSTFTVSIPLEIAISPESPSVVRGVAQVCQEPQHEQVRILVAEDNVINQHLISAMIAEAGWDADIVGNGEAAVEAVANAAAEGQPFELVFMDMQMPGMDGLTATRELRKAGFNADDLPIVALTANAYPEDIARCREAGMQAHVAKPIKLQELKNVVARFAVASAKAPASGSCSSALTLSTAGGKLGGMYAASKENLKDMSQSIDPSNVEQRWTELADALHKLAGVAGMFGEATLGETVAEIEHELTRTDDNVRRMELVDRTLKVIGQAA